MSHRPFPLPSILCVALLALVGPGQGGCSCEDDAASPGTGDGGLFVDGQMPDPRECGQGVVQCVGDVAHVCDGLGGYAETIDCAAEGKPCVNSAISQVTGELLPLGCVECIPGEASCVGDAARYCPEDGSGDVDFECDVMQGMTCEADGCKGRCAPPEVTTSYIGCDYFPTVTLNPVWQGFSFAVAVANASEQEASVLVTRGDDTVESLVVGPGALEVIELPWVLSLKGGDVNACQVTPDPGSTVMQPDGAYRLRTDQPVTVYQFSPLRYELSDDSGEPPAGCPLGVECSAMFGTRECLSYSNDASLLLPATTLGTDYTAMSWPSVATSASFVTITATRDDTRVQLEGQGSLSPGAGLGSDGQGEVRMDRGDVLQLVAGHAGIAGDATLDSDLTGSRILADKPVQVIGGNSCAFVPNVDAGQCDHLEHALFPSSILGRSYVVSYPAAVASTSPHVLRLTAIEAGTQVTFDPPVHAPVTLSPSDGPLDVQIGGYVPGPPGQAGVEDPPKDVHVSASAPLLAAQFMQGLTSVPSGSGDPSMALVVPVEQYRHDYTFIASATYDHNFINVIVPEGTTPVLDGVPVVASATAVGTSGLALLRLELDDSSEVHRITADEPFGLLVYGYGRFTSYMYPGGLDLRRIALPSPE